MTVPERSYRYVGPPELGESVLPGTGGHVVRSPADLDCWTSEHGVAEPFTYVVGPDGFLRLAPRRSEHVVCAGGGEVLGAGEIGFGRMSGRWTVREVSNQSTGPGPGLLEGGRPRPGPGRDRSSGPLHPPPGIPALRALRAAQRRAGGGLRLRPLRRRPSPGLEPGSVGSIT